MSAFLPLASCESSESNGEKMADAMPEREVVELEGAWSFQQDAFEKGKSEGWFDAPLSSPVAIEIGRPWECWFPNYDGVGWYERDLEFPESWNGRQILLQFDAVSYYCECWLNGNLLGSHEGSFTPFELDLTTEARFGESNRLTVRVINPPIDREIEGFRSGAPLNQSDIPIGKSAWYFNFGGIWQSVRLMSLPRTALKTVHLFPDLQRERIEVRIQFSNLDDRTNVSLLLAVEDPEDGTAKLRLEQSFTVEPGISWQRCELPLEGLELWSLENPKLYRFRVEAVDFEDGIEETFGVREFSFSNGRFVLNGRPVFVNGFLHQGHYPRTLAIPETREFAWAELNEVKRKGFNFVRITMKPAPSWYLEMADRIGLLIMHEPPIGWIANGPKTRERCLREIRELMLRDANHPSVVLIGLFNESFHLYGFIPEQVNEITSAMAFEARRIDPSRMIIDTSGGFSKKTLSGPDTMIHDSNKEGNRYSRAMAAWSTELQQIVDLHKYCPLPASAGDVDSYNKLSEPGTLIFVAEYGAPEVPPDFASVLASFDPDDAKRGLEDWQVHRDFSDSFNQRFDQSGLGRTLNSSLDFIKEINLMEAEECRRILHAIRSNPNVSGACFCQLADASGEMFGVTDVWRRPKPLYDALAAASTNPAIGIWRSASVLEDGERISLRVTAVADPDFLYSGSVEITLNSPDGMSAWSENSLVCDQLGPVILWEGEVGVALTPGLWNIQATISGGVCDSTHSVEVLVVPRAASGKRKIVLRDAFSTLEGYLRANEYEVGVYGNNWRDKNIPILLHAEAIPSNRAFYAELYGQLSKIVRLGGCAILFEPEVHALYKFLFPNHIKPQPAYRTCGYVLDHPIFEGLPKGTVAGEFYADVFPRNWDCGDDILEHGGEVLMGAFSMHMWTRPATYFWAAGLYRIPLGRGNIIVCHLPICGKLNSSAAARLLLNNLIDYAQSLIQTGGEEYLMARCIDPLPAAAMD